MHSPTTDQADSPSRNLWFFKWSVPSSMTKQAGASKTSSAHKEYVAWFVCSVDRPTMRVMSIKTGNCDCPGGGATECTHISALAHAICKQTPCTSQFQTWGWSRSKSLGQDAQLTGWHPIEYYCPQQPETFKRKREAVNKKTGKRHKKKAATKAGTLRLNHARPHARTYAHTLFWPARMKLPSLYYPYVMNRQLWS